MKKTRFLAIGLALIGTTALAVSAAVAQAPDRSRGQVERTRPRVMMLDGRGPQLGVTVEDSTEGVRIAEVDEESPAAAAGLLPGDVITEVDGERIRSARQFSRMIQETAEGRSVALMITRGGKGQTINVTPEAGRAAFGYDGDLAARVWRDVEPRLRELEPRLREFRYNMPNFDFDFGGLPFMTSPRARLGLQLSPLSSQLSEYFGAADGGVLVSSVAAGSAAQKAGLKAGDVITSIDGERVRSSSDLVDELRDKKGEVTIGYLRDKKESTTKATLEETRPRATFRRPA